MAYVKDLWTKPNPDGGKPKRVRSARWGRGKRWLAVWDEDGRKVSCAFAVKGAAEAHLEDVGAGQRAGTHITKERSAVTVAEMWPLWIAAKAGTAKKTRESYQGAWNRIEPRWGDVPCREVRRLDVEGWINGLTTSRGEKPGETRPLSASMRRVIGLTMTGILDAAEDQGVVARNPLAKMRKAAPAETSRRYLTVEELDALDAALPDDCARLVAATLVNTGVRPGEAFGFQVQDLDADRGRLRVQRQVDPTGKEGPVKTHQHRDVPVGGDLLTALEDAARGRARGDWLLRDGRGRGWTRNRWRPVWEALGVDYDTYDLRHTAASFAIHAGANVKTVQAMLGHKTAAMTLDRYGHLWPDELDAMPDRLAAHMVAERARFAERRRAATE